MAISHQDDESNSRDARPLLRKDGRAKYALQPRNSQGKFTSRKDLEQQGWFPDADFRTGGERENTSREAKNSVFQS
jgi:hypothetical protein